MQLKNKFKTLCIKVQTLIMFFKHLFNRVNKKLELLIKRRNVYQPIYPIRFDNRYGQVFENYLPLSNSLSHVSILCDLLFENNYKFSSLRYLQEQPNNQLTVSLRHDVDVHPPTALSMAKIYASYSVPASFYFLHSASYYMQIKDNLIYRNPELENWLTKIALYGCEVGLHNDSLYLANKLRVSAFDILSEELRYLRGMGLTIDGTSAHNSFPSHGAENFEVFKELQTFVADFYSKEQLSKITTLRSKYQISTVSMCDLGLKYEANFPISPKHRSKNNIEFFLSCSTGILDKQWMDIYLNHHPSLERSYGADIWIMGKNKWVISDRDINFYNHGCEIRHVKDYLQLPKKAKKLIITLHPEYFIQNK
ncbi:hypothetical protein MCEME20_00216 [Candidatus Pelagibacterales bacterium]